MTSPVVSSPVTGRVSRWKVGTDAGTRAVATVTGTVVVSATVVGDVVGGSMALSHYSDRKPMSHLPYGVLPGSMRY